MNTRTLSLHPHSLAATLRPLPLLPSAAVDALRRAGHGLWAALASYGRQRAAREIARHALLIQDQQPAVARLLLDQATEWRRH